MRNKKQISLLLAALFSLLLLLPGCGGASLPSLTVTFLSVEKADAIVLTCGGETLIIDAGETDDGDKLLDHLQQQNVTTVNTLLITHFDKDHVGGAAALLAGVTVKRVIVPAYTGSSDEYRRFVSAMETAGITPEALTEPQTFSLGDAQVSVDPPASYDIAGTTDDADNDLSLIATVTHGNNRLLFAGDAENARLNEWLSAGNAKHCELIKLPHHGKYHKELKNLLTATSPACAVICDSEKDPAEDKTLNLLTESNVKVYETKYGTVTAVSDGKKVRVETQTKE